MTSSTAWRSGVPGAIFSIAASSLRVAARVVLGRRAREAELAARLGSSSLVSFAARSASSPARDRLAQRLRLRRPEVCHARWRACRGDDAREAELRALLEPAVGLGRRAEAAGEADLAERGDRRPRTGTRCAAEAIASATARSAPGSSIRTPPATLTKTSACPSADARRGARARRRSSRAASGRRRSRRGAASRGRSARRAPGSRAGSAASPRARRRRRRPPRRRPCGRTPRTGRARRRGPAPVISKTPSSFVEPKRFFAARSTRCAR